MIMALAKEKVDFIVPTQGTIVVVRLTGLFPLSKAVVVAIVSFCLSFVLGPHRVARQRAAGRQAYTDIRFVVVIGCWGNSLVLCQTVLCRAVHA
jgi:hypothetical protein